MIHARPWDDLAAAAVFRDLDGWDAAEAGVTRGAAASHLALWADWRAIEGLRVASWVVYTDANRGARPFAVLGLANTGQAGVAQAALLARDHRRFRRELVELARMIRIEMPEFCGRLGVHRVEARSWACHPRAGRFLIAAGFRHECDMAGFGVGGGAVFRQFAWVLGLTHSQEG